MCLGACRKNVRSTSQDVHENRWEFWSRRYFSIDGCWVIRRPAGKWRVPISPHECILTIDSFAHQKVLGELQRRSTICPIKAFNGGVEKHFLQNGEIMMKMVNKWWKMGTHSRLLSRMVKMSKMGKMGIMGKMVK